MSAPKYIRISKQLEEAISEGIYKKQLPGLCKLAEEYGTTHITISKALRLLEEKGLVSVNGTRGTFISQNSNFRKYRVICVVGFSGNCQELKTIEKIAEEFRYQVVALSPNSSFQKLLENSPEFLVKFPADGYIFAQSVLTSKLATVLRSNGISFISLNRIVEPVGISWVDFDAEKNLSQLIGKVKARGHRRIAYVEFTNEHYNYSEIMYEVYKKSMADNFDREYFFSPGTQDEYLLKYGPDYCLQMADDAVEFLLRLRQRPTAVVVLADKIAKLMVGRLKKCGIEVPGDMSIVTYFAGYQKKHLAGFDFDLVDRVARASRVLLEQIKYQRNSVIQEFISSKFIDGPSLAWCPAEKSVSNKNIAEEVCV
jgi:DNA-binding LacI/PurR family transcriptional regulator